MWIGESKLKKNTEKLVNNRSLLSEEQTIEALLTICFPLWFGHSQVRDGLEFLFNLNFKFFIEFTSITLRYY